MRFKASPGFTLAELLIVVGVMAMLAAIIVVGVNPAKQISTTRNAQRLAALGNIQGAINAYAIENNGSYPAGIDTGLRMLGTATSGCAIACTTGTPVVPISTYTDSTSATFTTGATYTNTQWDAAVSSVDLSATGLTALTGTYQSAIKDAGANYTWTTLAWVPRTPYGKELPNNKVVETGYPGGATMTSNALLLHMNDSGTGYPVVDNSGNAFNGTVVPANYSSITSVAGRLNTALNFVGNTYITVPHNAQLNLSSSTGAIAFWMKPNLSTPIQTGSSMDIVRKLDGPSGTYSCQGCAGGYRVGLYREYSGQVILQTTLGWYLNGGGSSISTLKSTTQIANGVWYHVVVTWDSGVLTNNFSLYINGVREATNGWNNDLAWKTASPGPLYIGATGESTSAQTNYIYQGTLDEIALWNRALTAAEAADIYNRGTALRVRLQARSCDDAACSGETFKGPAGTTSDYYQEPTASTTTPLFSITNQPVNRYFQYKAFFDTLAATANPELKSVTVTNSNTVAPLLPDATADSCLNLSSLTPTLIQSFPFDPQTGSAVKTQYAVRKAGLDNLIIRACTPELGKTLEISQ